MVKAAEGDACGAAISSAAVGPGGSIGVGSGSSGLLTARPHPASIPIAISATSTALVVTTNNLVVLLAANTATNPTGR